MKINWDKVFSEASRSLSIQNVNPAASQGSRNIFAEDYKEIILAAKKYGYAPTNEKAKIVDFVRCDLDAQLEEALADVKAGRTSGPFNSVKELAASLKKQP